MSEVLLLDDFSRADGVSAIGTRWEGFTDRVMGGVSDMRLDFADLPAGRVLRMLGTVRLENRGGFIQARLPLDPRGGALDARAWDGVRITARGRPGPYYLHLRTGQNWLPWSYYRAPISVATHWREQFIPFRSFAGKAAFGQLDVSGLKSLALVAYGEAFEADLEVARIEFATGSI
jgi:hypothetical protein